MAKVDVKVPDIGDFNDMPVIEVLVKPGDVVKVDQSLITLESDKATMDVPSPVEGAVAEVLAKVGDKVSMGTLIARIEAAAGTAKAEAAPAKAAASPAPAKAASPAPAKPATPRGGRARGQVRSQAGADRHRNSRHRRLHGCAGHREFWSRLAIRSRRSSRS